MALITSAYNYDMEATLVLENGKEYDMITESFKYVIIDNDYDNKTMPIIYIGLNINSKLYQIMVSNTETATITFAIYKFNKNSSTKLRKNYIRGRFIYLMDSNPNYQESLENTTKEDLDQDTTGKDYKSGCLALMQIDSVNANRILINDIIKNSNLASIIHRYTKHMKMIIEPFPNNTIVNQLIIPPITSITDLLKYINDNVSIYPSGYRYYRDFDMTYLLSTEGNAISSGDNNYDALIIKVQDKLEDYGKINSTQIDKENKAYIINVDSDTTNIDVNIFREKDYNAILSVDSIGNKKKINLDIPKNKYSEERTLIRRAFNDNIDNIDTIKDAVEKSSIILNVIKTEIDNSIITPNRQYQVQNYKTYKKYDGKYLLSYKRETFLPQEHVFINGTDFGLRKIIE